MAGFRTHITVSTIVGIGYGAAAVKPLGFSSDAAILAAGITAIGGMLPDLDSGPGRPLRELSAVAAAVIPLLLVPRLTHAEMTHEGLLVTLMVLYFAIRFGASKLLSKITVHRGMFHSIPAMLIAGLVVYLEYGSVDRGIRVLLSVGVMLGFLSHLVLDEIYSVDLNGMQIRLKSSAGSAVKFFSDSLPANIVCYGLLIMLAAGTKADWDAAGDSHWGALQPWIHWTPPTPPRLQ